MEKTLCQIRELYRAIATFEEQFAQRHHLCLNEGMVLCSLSKVERLSAGELAGLLGLTTSNASKVIRSVESKGLVERVLGDRDKRQMYFSLTDTGKQRLHEIKSEALEIPSLLNAVL